MTAAAGNIRESSLSSAALATLLVYTSLAQAATNVPVDHYWDGVLQAYACVNVTQPLAGWTAHLLFDADVASIEVWDAVQTKVNSRDFILTNQHYNADQGVGATMCIYFRAHMASKSDPAPTMSIYIEGMDGPTSAPVISTSTSTAAPTPIAVPGKRFNVEIVREWPGGFQGSACVDVFQHFDGWRARLKFGKPGITQLQNIWHADATKLSKRHYVLNNKNYNAVLEPGDRVCVGFVANCDCSVAPTTKIFIEGNKKQRPPTVSPTSQPPSTQPPSTQPPSTQPPSTQPPSTQPPSTQPPSTQPPSTQPPSTQTPSTQPPSTQPPSTQPPSTQPPSTQPPSTQPPSTQPPSTQPPSTQPPSTQPPSTQPPSTQPPSTQPPSTQPPSTQPPSTQPPSTQPPSTQPPSTQPPSTQPPSTQPPSTQPPSGSTSTGAPVTDDDITESVSYLFPTYPETPVSVPVSNEWNGGFQADPCIDIYTHLDGWTAHLHFGSDIDTVEVWVATPTQITPRHFRLDDLNGEQLVPGDRLCFTFVARCTCTQAPDISIYIEGNIGGDGGDGGDSGGDDGQGGGGYATKNYTQALEMSILFYAAQRSGELPDDNPIPWRGDSALGDCVTGGWYDAGDHVKFGLPMASSTTLLTWSLIQFKAGYEKAGQLDQMYDSVRWPLDYFLAAWEKSPPRLLVQVGDGNADHAYWGRAEEMTMQRPCQYVSAGNKGSDIAAETAAAMAAGSIAFQDKGETSYSAQLRSAAASMYTFAKNNRGVFTGAAPFYSSSGDADELCVAAMFLYQATGDTDYLADAQSFVNTGTPWSLSWDNKFIACQILLYQETNQYKSAVQNFFHSWSQSGSLTYTPCGLAWRDQWGATRYAGNAAFAALVAADLDIDRGANRKWAVEQINYILGDNRVNGQCFSFVVGYGDNFPQRPHHRGASCPDQPAPCGWNQESASSPNPQVLYGALVGGPDASDNYNDDRSDFISNEVATDYNAGFQGALAGIVSLEDSNQFPVTSNNCACGV